MNKNLSRFPRGLGPEPEVAPTATARWFPPGRLHSLVERKGSLAYREGNLWLGRTLPDDSSEGLPVGFMDDRHVVTIAGSRAGKGVSAIVPVLCTYPGSVVCIDPKGENAALTARRRGFGTSSVEGMGQEVYVLDPYEIADTDTLYRGTFDPLAGLGPDAPHTQEEVSLVVEALVVAGETKDVHWDDSARNLIEAIILHVVSWEELKAPRNLVTMYKLLRDGDTASRDAMLESVQKKHGEVPAWAEELSGFDILLMDMSRNDAFDGFISGAASGLRDLGKQERGSILSTARRNTKFLSASEMQACLSASDHELSLEELRTASRGITIYVVLPARLMAQHARWLRLLLNLTLSRLERMGPVKSKRPVLAILDEFPTLGYMETLENAVGYMAGFGLKIWAILQDLPQLKRHYEHGWETFLGNAGLLQFFGNSDSTTLTYISERLGKTELIRETETQSDTETTTITDISDFEKLQHATKASGLDGFLKSFQVDEKTETTSHSIARSASLNAAIHTTPLMTPDEISRFFARETNLQIAILPRARPMVLRRTSYFNDPFFTGKYEKMDGPVVKRDEAGPPAA